MPAAIDAIPTAPTPSPDREPPGRLFRRSSHLTEDERERFLAAAAREPKPEHQTFARAIAHSGARLSEVLALRPVDIDLNTAAIRIQTLKRRAEHWREVPLPPERPFENAFNE